ncbi:MAG: glucose-1-phosphate cytidylyltransferase [Ginsengibacter sp.]
MKVVIFAGGLGTRISEESHLKPKPMIEIGGRPIIWHIMKIYESYGHNEFIICCGYKAHIIKEYFLNYFLYNSDVTVEVQNNKLDVHYTNAESFKVTLVDTGKDTKTAGRLRQVKKYLNGDTFMLTYGDGVSDININELVRFHKKHKKLATVTAVQPPGRFGNMKINKEGTVVNFKEKQDDEGLWINGGYFVLEPGIFNYLPEDSDDIMWEDSPLVSLTNAGELVSFKHYGFWKCMDAMRDRIELEELWESNEAKWKIW